jgi:hypothetical protein
MNKAIYIGAGNDIKPLVLLNIKEFIYIDKKPLNDELLKIMIQLNYKIIEQTDSYYIFKNYYNTIKYYYNCEFPNVNQDIIDEIRSYDTLICSKYNPDIKILEYLENKINFISSMNKKLTNEENTLFNEINKNYNLFKNYYLILLRPSSYGKDLSKLVSEYLINNNFFVKKYNFIT